ncbi:unnamed protein product [Blepharisma stoltei]|uniref:Uncharacterized protein n=1 Tax=Blepharisma stoltei TaxID=1481888 RepID=A0AAU9JUL2_9CILI|nr:unnamed protein product [Blepharisma stoltei]
MAEEMNDGLALRTNSFENSHSFANFALKIVKESIFGGFCCLSIAKKKTVYNLSIQKFVKILKSIIIFLQISRLNWKIDADPENQKLEHWKILGYASFDQIFVDFGNLSLCFIGFSIIVWICTLFIVIFSLMSHYKKNISEYLTFFPKLLVIFLATIGYIPFLLIFLLTIKYSVKDQNIVEEFWKCENCNLNL